MSTCEGSIDPPPTTLIACDTTASVGSSWPSTVRLATFALPV